MAQAVAVVVEADVADVADAVRDVSRFDSGPILRSWTYGVLQPRLGPGGAFARFVYEPFPLCRTLTREMKDRTRARRSATF